MPEGCDPCPQNGHCDEKGGLICNAGYIKSSKQCVDDKEYTQTAIQYAQKYHEVYLYHLGDEKCGRSIKPQYAYDIHIKTGIRDDNSTINTFVDSRVEVDKETFESDILKHAKELYEADESPRFDLICRSKIFIGDNLLLIIVSIIGLLWVTYIIMKVLYYFIYKYKARGIYHKLEKELKSVKENGQFNSAVPESDIIDGYKNTMSDKTFTSYIMPWLEHFRKQDGNVKKFTEVREDKDVILWHYK